MSTDKLQNNNKLLPVCKYNKTCGGCSLQGKTYEEQLKIKQTSVERLLSSIHKVENIIPAPTPYNYRNKVTGTYGYVNKKTVVGTYQENSHKLVPIESCQIHDEIADTILQTIKDLLASFKYKTFDEDSRSGFFRHVLIRTGHVTKQVLVTLVVADIIFPSKNNFIKALLKKHPEITSVVMNINNKKTSMILGEREIVLYGKGYIEDFLCGKKFRISPKSFYQINSIQTEILYKEAIECAKLTGKETIIDAYCGIGTIGIIASNGAKEVLGVELNKDAFKDAIVNARENKVKNIKFINEDAGKFMVNLAHEKKKIDVVFLDPPRAGSDEAFLKSLVTLNPERVVYISCNPETLARDLEFLKKYYVIETIQPVDMFPFTEHVEAIAVLFAKS